MGVQFYRVMRRYFHKRAKYRLVKILKFITEPSIVMWYGHSDSAACRNGEHPKIDYVRKTFRYASRGKTLPASTAL